MQQRSEIVYQLLRKRLETVLPMAARESVLDIWLILCQEDDLDPVLSTVISTDT